MKESLVQNELIYRFKMYRKNFYVTTVYILVLVKMIIFSNILFWGLGFLTLLKISLFLILVDAVGLLMIHYHFQKSLREIQEISYHS